MSSASCPARRDPDETVIYTAHWDHLGIGQPDANGDRIYNGAIDNGTGLAQLIEQARAFAHGPRTAALGRVHGRDGRGEGPARQRILCRQPALSAGKTAGVINTDVLGVLGPARDFTIRGNQKFGLLDMLVEEGAKRGRRYTPDPQPETGGFFRSDHFTLAKVGVPAISFGPGQDLVNGGVARARGVVGKLHRQDVSPAGRRIFARLGLHAAWSQDASLLHAVGRAARQFSRDGRTGAQDSEFRAARDRTRRRARRDASRRRAGLAKPGERG